MAIFMYMYNTNCDILNGVDKTTLNPNLIKIFKNIQDIFSNIITIESGVSDPGVEIDNITVNCSVSHENWTKYSFHFGNVTTNPVFNIYIGEWRVSSSSNSGVYGISWSGMYFGQYCLNVRCDDNILDRSLVNTASSAQVQFTSAFSDAPFGIVILSTQR